MMWRRRYIFDPFYELKRMEEWMNDLMGEMQTAGGLLLPESTGKEVAPISRVPSIDLIDKGDTLVLRADVPGVDKSDISVNMKDDMIEISAERKGEEEVKEEGYIRRERHYAKYYRAVPLPASVDKDAITATFENGVLEVTMPKVAAEEVKKIEVK
ncbi:MAG: Hsp20/alpha crystallin family protein [Candidatus Syntropharchaeales archaeon]